MAPPRHPIPLGGHGLPCAPHGAVAGHLCTRVTWEGALGGDRVQSICTLPPDPSITGELQARPFRTHSVVLPVRATVPGHPARPLPTVTQPVCPRSPRAIDSKADAAAGQGFVMQNSAFGPQLCRFCVLGTSIMLMARSLPLLRQQQQNFLSYHLVPSHPRPSCTGGKTVTGRRCRWCFCSECPRQHRAQPCCLQLQPVWPKPTKVKPKGRGGREETDRNHI